MALSHSDFISRALKAHGDRYEYFPSSYQKMSIPVLITCKIHGDFTQLPSNHLQGHGCALCGGSSRLSQDEFLAKAFAVHGEKYDYSLVEYKNYETKILISCPIHGNFIQKPDAHLSGKGCRECAGNKLLTTEKFIARAVLLHGDKYDYSPVVYKNAKSPVKIICKDHGDFMQTPDVHLAGSGCMECSYGTLTGSEFIKRASLIHGDTYDYSLVDYVNSKTKVKIVCETHGVFEQVPNGHLNGAGCIPCSSYGPSKGELRVSEFVSSLVETRLSDKTIISPLEIDCFIPSRNLGLEYCGIYFHSERFRPKTYHLDKLVSANLAGVDLIQIFEDEWLLSEAIVRSIIKSRLGLCDTKIPARKTQIEVLSFTECSGFLKENHLQGMARAEILLGLRYQGNLVMAATFSNSRNILGTAPAGEYELVRLCARLNTVVVGGFSKLLGRFIAVYCPASIKSFCDRRYFTGKGYESVGFIKSHDSPPNYYYVKDGVRYSRYRFQKHTLSKKLETVNPQLTERQNLLDNGYFRIYDCGNAVYRLALG